MSRTEEVSDMNINHTAVIEELKKIIAVDGLSDEHLRWIVERSELREYEDGELVTRTGDSTDFLWFLLEGKLSFYMDVNGTLVYYLTFDNDRSSGGVSGLLPHSRMTTSPGSSFSVGNLRVLLLHKKYFPELEQLNPNFIQRLIGYMTERARTFATVQLQREKVSALGKLSAGIAHELNNPASAINRIADELKTRLNSNYELTSKLLAHDVNSQIMEDLQALAKEKESKQIERVSAMHRMEAEDAIADWFSDNGFKNNRSVAETFSEFGFSTDDLESLRGNVTGEAFSDLIRWMENLLISGRLIKDLEDASGRISHLVGAIKSHVRMDRTDDIQRTNIHTDIENTLTLLGYKLRDKNISVEKGFCSDMPIVEAYIGELNQVWTNLIDNAIDAMNKGGELTIESSCSKKEVTVRVIDNGSGIPKEILSRIFDPFFTTKKVGQGTGIGLDIVKRIIDRHHGEIKVNSVPGRTEFVVCIPIAQQLQKT
jgi:signal transduction histidine kinase